MRILIYGMNYFPEPIGVGKYTGELGEYLADQGFELEVVTAQPHYPGWAVPAGYSMGYSVDRNARGRTTRCPLFLTSKMRGIWRALAPLSFAIASAPVVVWRIFTTRPDAILCVEPTLFAAPVALLAGKLIGARTILHVQDLEIDAAFGVKHLAGNTLRSLADAFERTVLNAFDAVITISHRMAEKLTQKGVRSNRMHLIRNWVDLDKIKPLDGPSPYRAELGIGPNRFVVLYAGNIGVKQALGVVLEAAERLADTAEPFFVIVGDGPEKAALTNRFGHLKNVAFLPTQPAERLCTLLNLADIHVLPQDRNAADLVLPSKLGGMLASEKPIIVMADHGTELSDFLGEGVILVPPGDVEGLACAISEASRGQRKADTSGNAQRVGALDASHCLPEFANILTKKRALIQSEPPQAKHPV